MTSPQVMALLNDWFNRLDFDRSNEAMRHAEYAELQEILAALAQPAPEAKLREGVGALIRVAAECHRAKWQFDFNDEKRLSVGMARDMVKRAFDELHRIGDLALKEKAALSLPHGAGECSLTIFPEDDWPERNKLLAEWFNGLSCASEEEWDALCKILNCDAAPSPLSPVTVEALAKAIRGALIEDWKNAVDGSNWREDVLLTGCKKVGGGLGYKNAEEAAQNLALDAAKAIRALLASPAPSGETDWKDDPSSDERWNAGLDFGMRHFCYALGVDPKSVRWDAATETLDGDVIAVIWNILRAKMGDDWDPDAPHPIGNASEAGPVSSTNAVSK